VRTRTVDSTGWTRGHANLYAHYFRGTTRIRSVKLGALTGPCGTFKRRVKEFPFKGVKAGEWRVFFSDTAVLDKAKDPFVRRTVLMVAPLNIARGTQNKILEAMAMGVPVITSSIAAGGVDAVPGEHLIVTTGSAECADAVLRIMSDKAERARLAAAGRARVLSHHAWPASMQRLDAIVERCRRGFEKRVGAAGLVPATH